MSDFININKILNHETNPMTRIIKIIIKLERLQYAHPLALNMGYYHVSTYNNSSNSYTIIILWVK